VAKWSLLYPYPHHLPGSVPTVLYTVGITLTERLIFMGLRVPYFGHFWVRFLRKGGTGVDL